MKFIKKDKELNFGSKIEYKNWRDDLLIEIPKDVYKSAVRWDQVSPFNIWVHDTPYCIAEICGDVLNMSSDGYYPVCITDYQDNIQKFFLVKKADIYEA